MLNHEVRWLVAPLQAVIGVEWLVSGVDKVLSGSFPRALGVTLADGIKGNPNGWYVGLLQALVLPHSVVFGYLIEIAEVVAGSVLIAGALLLLTRFHARGERRFRLEVGLVGAAVVAALTCAFLCLNFRFWMGDGLLPGLDASHPFNEGIDLDTLMVGLALIVAVANARIWERLTDISLLARGKVLMMWASTVFRAPKRIGRMTLSSSN